MIFVLLALAIGPGLAISIYIFYRDRFDREPLHLLVKCFLLGMLCTLPAVILQLTAERLGIGVGDSLRAILLLAFILAGLVEELCKFAVLRLYAYPRAEFNEPFDGITYSVMVAMGFATVENLLYVLQGGLSVGVLRMFSAVPSHAIFGILMGYCVGLAKFHQRSLSWLVVGVLVAAAFHGFYDFCLLEQKYHLLSLGSLVALGVGGWLSLQAIRIHLRDSPYRAGR